MSRMAEPTPIPKAQPYTFDLGHMLCIDSNPIPVLTPANKETLLTSTAQGCAQALINQLLSACEIARSTDGDLQIRLPAPETRLPREKHVPKDKEKTRWEKFADKKGIKAKRKDGKLAYDEASGEWKPKYGYKGKKAEGEDWLVEIDEKAEKRKAEGVKEGGNKRKGASEDAAARKAKLGRKGR